MVKVGDRIRLLKMDDDPCPLPVGATGTIKATFPQPAQRHGPGPWTQYHIEWDAPHEKRSLMLCCPPDQFEIIDANHLPS